VLSGYKNWSGFEPLLSEDEYNCLDKKLTHIASYISDYLDPNQNDYRKLAQDLELDATISYLSAKSCSERLTPWLLHSSMTFEIRPSEITVKVAEVLISMMQYRPTADIATDIAFLAKKVVESIEFIRNSIIGSDCLTLLYAIDVCLVAIIDRICWERLFRLLKNEP
jgi:hypothetical protein